jgi:hypothetical protein
MILVLDERGTSRAHRLSPISHCIPEDTLTVAYTLFYGELDGRKFTVEETVEYLIKRMKR